MFHHDHHVHHVRQKNIFEIETIALAHVACAPRESGILLTDFAAAYPGVNDSWIFHVLEKQNCLSLFAASHEGSGTIEFAGMTRGQFLMARGVRQGCAASGFLFVWAFDPFFRWLQDEILFPRNLAGLDFLQPAQCAYADDLAVAALSFRCLMIALAPACSNSGSNSWAQFEPSEMLLGAKR